MKIGVFDSGIGGLSVTNAIKKAIPEATTLWVSDHDHVPYGDKPPQEVFGYVLPLLQSMVVAGCDVIVIACNTVTTTLIEQLRKQVSVPLIGIEPMVEQAVAVTKSGVIAVCATPSTLASKRYTWLKETHASNVTVREPDCSKWAYMIEHKQMDEKYIEQEIHEVCEKGADVIVLGCTHYHWIEDVITRVTNGRAVILQPEPMVVAELQAMLADTTAPKQLL